MKIVAFDEKLLPALLDALAGQAYALRRRTTDIDEALATAAGLEQLANRLPAAPTPIGDVIDQLTVILSRYRVDLGSTMTGALKLELIQWAVVAALAESKPARSDDMRIAFAKAFEEWERRYRENPEDFMTEVRRLLDTDVVTYGESCAVYFIAILDALSGGQPWKTIADAERRTNGFTRGVIVEVRVEPAEAVRRNVVGTVEESVKKFNAALDEVNKIARDVVEDATPSVKFDDIVNGYAERASREAGGLATELAEPMFATIIRAACEDVLKRQEKTVQQGRPAGVP